MKRALITGITGQDGSYLAEHLLGLGYEVHGILRRSSSLSTVRIQHLCECPSLQLHHGDLSDGASLRRLVGRIAPDEVYNLGAQSQVRVSFDQAEYTADVSGTGVLRMLEAIRDVIQEKGRPIRVYQAGSSEMFGAAMPPQSESTPFHPRSPYAVAKAAGHWYGVNYRESYGMFVCNGILFNHESPRRGETFVTRKITLALARIQMGLQERLCLGNLDSRRDWGFAGDYVRAMHLMLQQEEPGDYVIATGRSFSVREFLDEAAGHLKMDWSQVVQFDPACLRPAEVNHLLGDPSKAMAKLGWKPEVDFPSLVKMMVEHDLELARREKALAGSGFPLQLQAA